MSVTNIRSLRCVRDAADYVEEGRPGDTRLIVRKAGGGNRAAAFLSDTETTNEFIAFCEQTAEENGREVEALSIVQSFRGSDLDKDNPDDVKRSSLMGYDLAKRLYPNSPCMVVVHTDSKGGFVHNHILIANHDLETGRAISSNNWHKTVSRVNDQLMRENDIKPVIKSWEKTASKEASLDDEMEIKTGSGAFWENRREGKELAAFDENLHARISAAIQEDRPKDFDEFVAAVSERGIKVETKVYKIHASKDGTKPEKESLGITYKMYDEWGEKPRWRKRKADNVDQYFKINGLEKIFEINRNPSPPPPPPPSGKEMEDAEVQPGNAEDQSLEDTSAKFAASLHGSAADDEKRERDEERDDIRGCKDAGGNSDGKVPGNDAGDVEGEGIRPLVEVIREKQQFLDELDRLEAEQEWIDDYLEGHQTEGRSRGQENGGGAERDKGGSPTQEAAKSLTSPIPSGDEEEDEVDFG